MQLHSAPVDSPGNLSGKPDSAGKSYRWSRPTYNRWARLIDIGQVATQFLLHLWLDRQSWSYGTSKEPTPEQMLARQQVRAVWIRESLLHLGPTFIKMGQFFSTRADLFAAPYIEELSKLQDQVPAFGYDQVVEIVTAELGAPANEIFARFDPVPIAAASLGQVHRAKLHSGEEVAVKVQRPGLQQLFRIDLAILRSLATFIQHRTPLGEGGRDWLGIYNECHQSLWEEVDYLNEGRNANAFRRNFSDVDNVVVPHVFWRFTTPRVLTLEYVPGIKVTDFPALDAAGIDRRQIAHLGAHTYLQQVLHHGFFHADPHPGNLAVDSEGTLIFYDFGMMGRIPSQTKDRLMLNFRGIMQQDARLVVQAMVELGAIAADTDLGPVRRSVQYMLDTYFNQAMSEHANVSMAAINDDLYELTYNQPFRFPAAFTFVLRSLSALEALGKSLDPDFNFMDVAQPFAEEIMAQESGGSSNRILEQLGRQAAEFTNTSFNLPQRVDETLTQLEQGDLKMRVSAVELNRDLRKLNSTGRGIIYGFLAGVVILCVTQLLIAQLWWAAGCMTVLGLAPGIALLRVLLRQGDI